MRGKQRFHSKPDYIPKVYGYAQSYVQPESGLVDQEQRIKLYYELKKLDVLSPFNGAEWVRTYCEPVSLKARGYFKYRPEASELLKELKPGDHVITAELRVVANNIPALLSEIRFLDELGVHLHVIDFLGLAINFSSTAGTMVVGHLEAFGQFDADLKSEARLVAGARKRADKAYGGGGIPQFCRLVKGGVRHKLVFQGWALPIMKRIEAGDDQKAVHLHLKKIMGCGVTDRRVYDMIYYLRDFYAAWKEIGQPDLNTIVVSKLIKDYREKNRG